MHRVHHAASASFSRAPLRPLQSQEQRATGPVAGEGQFAGSHLCSWAFSGGLSRAEMSGAPVDIALRGSIAKVRVRRPSAGVAPRGSFPPSGGSLRALNQHCPRASGPRRKAETHHLPPLPGSRCVGAQEAGPVLVLVSHPLLRRSALRASAEIHAATGDFIGLEKRRRPALDEREHKRKTTGQVRICHLPIKVS